LAAGGSCVVATETTPTIAEASDMTTTRKLTAATAVRTKVRIRAYADPRAAGRVEGRIHGLVR
jgi:hypothetical protein